MIHVRALSESERKQFRRLARREVGRVSERIHMVLLSDRHYSVPQIAAVFECSEATVREWLERFESQGVEGLRDLPRSGRPRKADAIARDLIRRQIETSPQSLGYLFGYWTVATLCSHLAGLGLCLGRAVLRRALLELGLVWRRPKHTLPEDPKARERMWALFERVMRASTETVLLACDECDLHLLPVLRAMWMSKGEQARVPTPGSNRKRSVFGALEFGTGRWTYGVFERRRSAEFIEFLEQLLVTYPGRPILLVLDNASIHTAKVVGLWLDAHPRLEVVWLPSYSGHKQNPVEKVWWRLKDKVAANRLHCDIDELVACVHQFFASFTPEMALKLAA